MDKKKYAIILLLNVVFLVSLCFFLDNKYKNQYKNSEVEKLDTLLFIQYKNEDRENELQNFKVRQKINGTTYEGMYYQHGSDVYPDVDYYYSVYEGILEIQREED